MEKTLPRSTEIRNKAYEISNTSPLQRKKYQLKKEILEKEERLPHCESVEEHRIILDEIRDLEQQITEVDIELRVQPKKEKHFRENELQKLPAIYNEEFKPYYDQYVKLDKELKKRLQKIAKEIEPLVVEMKEIERLELDFHMLKNQVLGRRSEFIELPISGPHTNGQSLKPGYNFFASGDFTLASQVKTLISQIQTLK